MTTTWAQRLAELTQSLGREPTTVEIVKAASEHDMTPAEITALATLTRGLEPSEVGNSTPADQPVSDPDRLSR